jgi:predicted nucleic acid-binding protein
MNAIDTNVWIYCHDTRDLEKQQTAQKLISTIGAIVLLWQVGCEFIAAARKLETLGFKPDDAWEALADMQAMAEKVVMPSPNLWPHCRTLQQNHSLHFWDALLICCCLNEGVSVLYSEDIGEGNIAGLRIVNPFARRAVDTP